MVAAKGFQKAQKQQSYTRLGAYGPSGSGKTFSSLRVATGMLRVVGGRIAVICSERGSASKYADRFDFDVLDLEERTVDAYIEAIKMARDAKYSILIIDSSTHAWQELLEEVDKLASAKFKGNKWSAWSEGTPKQKAFIDAILHYPGHIIVTMRAKTEWETGADDKKPKRIGLAPEQGKGIEYEFDLLVALDTNHTAIVEKDRTGRFQDKIIEKPGEEFGEHLAKWLSDGTPPPPPPATDTQRRRVSQLLKDLDVKDGKAELLASKNDGAPIESGADADRVIAALEKDLAAKKAADAAAAAKVAAEKAAAAAKDAEAKAAAANPTPPAASSPAPGATPPATNGSASALSTDELLAAPSVDDPTPAMRAWITRYTDKIDALSTEKELMALFDASRNAVNALPKPFDEAIKNYELKALNRVYGDESWSPFSNEQLAGLARLEQLRGKKSAPPATTSATA